MDIRKKFIPRYASGRFWAPFFDPKIQKVLKARKKIDTCQFCESDEHRFAWPLAVYEVATSFALAAEGDAQEYGQFFAQSYELDPEFSSALLLALTVYFNDEQPASNRKFREEDDPFFGYRKSTWQDIAFKISGNDHKKHAKNFAKIGAKEIKRCMAILTEWKVNFESRERLVLKNNNSPHGLIVQAYPLAICPRQKITPQFLSPKPENK